MNAVGLARALCEGIISPMVKKKIQLAGMWRRIAAHGIDLASTLTLSALFYFILVLPLSVDTKAIDTNNRILAKGQVDSSLYFSYSDGILGTPFDGGNFTSI